MASDLTPALRDELVAVFMRVGISRAEAEAFALVADIDARRIGLDTVGKVEVSTIYMPAIVGCSEYWETRISSTEGQEFHPWPDEAAAREGHARIVQKLIAMRDALNGEPGR